LQHSASAAGNAATTQVREHRPPVPGVTSHPLLFTLLDQIWVRWGGGEAAAPTSSLSGSAA
jgi:hypothetical protein